MVVIDCRSSYHRRAKLNISIFRSRDIHRLIPELDPHCGDYVLFFLSFFFKEVPSVLAPKLSMMFSRFLPAGLFPSQYCCDDVVRIP